MMNGFHSMLRLVRGLLRLLGYGERHAVGREVGVASERERIVGGALDAAMGALATPVATTPSAAAPSEPTPSDPEPAPPHRKPTVDRPATRRSVIER